MSLGSIFVSPAEARIVTHPFLDQAEIPLPGLGHQLGVDEEVVCLDLDLVEHLAAEHLERAVDIANPHTE